MGGVVGGRPIAMLLTKEYRPVFYLIKEMYIRIFFLPRNFSLITVKCVLGYVSGLGSWWWASNCTACTCNQCIHTYIIIFPDNSKFMLE